MLSLSFMALMATTLPAGPAPDTTRLQLGAVFGVHHLRVFAGMEREADRFFRRDYFPAWATLLPGTHVFYVIGDRGKEAGTPVFFWLLESQAVRDRYYPEATVSTPAYRERRVTIDWVYADSTYGKLVETWGGGFTDWVVITAPPQGMALRPGMVFGLHAIDLRPGADTAAFERFLREEFVPGGGYRLPGATPFFLKGDRGDHLNGFGLLWVFDSVEVRDRYFPSHGATSEAWQAVSASWQLLDDRLQSFIASWRPASQTDYRIIQ